MGRNQTIATARQIHIAESCCHICKREFKTRDLRLNTRMLKLHLQKEHNRSGENITDFGNKNTTLTAENSNGVLPWEEVVEHPKYKK